MQSKPNDHVVACCRQRGEAQAKLAVADRDAAVVHVYDTRSGSDDPVASSADVHRSPVVAMRYNEPHDTVISTDAKGVQPERQAERRCGAGHWSDCLTDTCNPSLQAIDL